MADIAARPRAHKGKKQIDVLLIESDAHRRVSVAQYLLRATHRVTISSSIEEAREILQFMTESLEAPDAVVIGENLLSTDSTEIREEIAYLFPEADWVPLPPNLTLRWLGDWLEKARSWKATRNTKSMSHGSRVLFIETDSAARQDPDRLHCTLTFSPSYRNV